MCLSELAFFRSLPLLGVWPEFVVLFMLVFVFGYEMLVTFGEADEDEVGEPELFVVEPPEPLLLLLLLFSRPKFELYWYLDVGTERFGALMWLELLEVE